MLPLKNHLIRTAAVGAVGVAVMTGFVAPASAAPAAAASAGLARATAAALPNVNIQGSPAKWSPAKLSVTPKPFTTCTRPKEVWTITNKTKKAADVSYKVGSGKKKALGKVAAGGKAGVCSEGSKGTKETFYIKGSKSVLTLTLK